MFKKRLFDLVVVFVTLPVTIPLICVVSCLVYSFLGRPVFFRQTRIGFLGKPFTIIKFRSMSNLSDSNGLPLSDGERLSTFGNFLRRSSLDELPEILNIIKGEMSLVGPRPLLPEYLAFYNSRQLRRHDVRPGLTGLAQIKGRNNMPWHESLELDVQYVESLSMLGDAKILIRTLLRVVTAADISEDGVSTRRKFTGNRDE